MPDAGALEKYYETLTDAQLLNLRSEGGFTEQAEQVLADELKRRNLRASDVKRYAVPERIKLRDEAQEKGFAGRGPALRFFGRRYLNEADKTANIQLRTKWFALGGIPIVPLASYRFKCTGTPSKWFGGDTEQRVINRVPLNWPQVFLTWRRPRSSFFSFFFSRSDSSGIRIIKGGSPINDPPQLKRNELMRSLASNRLLGNQATRWSGAEFAGGQVYEIPSRHVAPLLVE